MAGRSVYHLSIGELILCREPAVISTILGSCVAVSLFCRPEIPQSHGAGGLIHYALPHAPHDVDPAESFRYGDVAIPSLVEELERLTGEDRRRFEAKITGGASGLGSIGSEIQAGPANIEIAVKLLARLGVKVVGKEVGGKRGRKVLFHTDSGRLQVAELKERSPKARRLDARLLAIGASTGGTEALKSVLSSLPEHIPPTLIVQHIPPVFSRTFADRLNELCPFEVKEAEDGDLLKVSRVLIAPGGLQMKIQNSSRGPLVRITDDPPMNRHKPSVDYLFQSVASVLGSKAVGVVLTGMGDDGAKGLLEMRSKGAKTIAQDEESSVVYGMPRVAFESGAVEMVASLSEIPQLILTSLGRRKCG